MSRPVRVGDWRIWLGEAAGSGGPVGHAAAVDDAADAARAWIALVADAERAGVPLHRSKHAATHRLRRDGRDVYLKIYRRYRVGTAIKDLARRSKARHVLEVGRLLRDAGFAVPEVLAAAEERRGPWVRRSWVVTAALSGSPLASHLETLATAGAPRARSDAPARAALGAKRALLAAVGAEVGRLHAAGFVAGDLVPANVWIVCGETGPGAATVGFIDHDRTRALATEAPWWRARRNLVQLNRVVLPSIVLTDRWRVYRAYAAARGWTAATARRRVRWIVAKTIERRVRFDHVRLDARRAVSFRELMRPGGPLAPHQEAP